MDIKKIVDADGKEKFTTEIPIKFYTDPEGNKWMIWGDKTQEEMAKWVNELKQKTADAELKAKLVIVGGIIVSVVGGYVGYKLFKRMKRWNHDRQNVKRWEEEREQAARQQAEKTPLIGIYEGDEVVIVGQSIPGYKVEPVPA